MAHPSFFDEYAYWLFLVSMLEERDSEPSRFLDFSLCICMCVTLRYMVPIPSQNENKINQEQEFQYTDFLLKKAVPHNPSCDFHELQTKFPLRSATQLKHTQPSARLSADSPF